MIPVASLNRLLAFCVAASVYSFAPTALAQGASTALPSARPSAAEALEAALFGLLDAELDRGFEMTIDVREAVMSGDKVTAIVDVDVLRNSEFLHEVALTLLPFQSQCESTHCLPIRIFGSGEVYGRAGFVDVYLPTAARGRDRELTWYARHRPLSVVVELVDPDGRVLHRAARRLRGADITFPLGFNPLGGSAQSFDTLSTRLLGDVYGPITTSLRMEGIPEAVWQAAATVSATIISSADPRHPNAEVQVAIGILIPPEDATELFVVPGVLIVEAFSRTQLVQGPADRDTTWNAATIRRLEGARVITHIDDMPVVSIEQLADVVFQYREVQVGLRIWDQATASSYDIDCRLPGLTGLTRNTSWDTRALIPVLYPVYESLNFGGRPLPSDGFGQGSGVFTRAVHLQRLMMSVDCLQNR